tara:strand:+ start:1630 stop:2649 length:1020 start_codon:yes stop_codon:yes gene_type:complete
MQNNVYFLFIIPLFFSCNNSGNKVTVRDSVVITSYSQKTLQEIDDRSLIIRELKDVFHAYKVNLIIADHMEAIDRFKEVPDSYIKACEAQRAIIYNDDSLSNYVNSYISAAISNYNVIKTDGFESDNFKDNVKHFMETRNMFFIYLQKTYSTNHFIDMEAESYWKNIDKANYTLSPKYPVYQKLLNSDVIKAVTLLQTIAENVNNFQEEHIYKIEIADQFVKNSDSLNDISGHLAIEKYKELIDRNAYSLYLFETWIKWRVLTQFDRGLSKDSDIPNKYYDEIREHIATVILAHITNNPKDEMAVNQFMLMASHDIIRRFGEYPYGNQSTIEYHRLFDD